jgi:hypothetical protein
MSGKPSKRSTKLQLDGPGPFVTPKTAMFPFILSPAGEESLFHLGLTLEDERQLLIPVNASQLRKLWRMLDNLVGSLGPEKES